MTPATTQSLHRRPAIVLFCSLLFPAMVCLAQGNKLDSRNLEETMRNPWMPDRSVFLQDWLVLGSIPINGINDIDADFLGAIGGEAAARPVEGQTVTIAGIEMKWIAVHCKDIVDLQKFFQGGRTEDAVAYAATTINRKEAGKAYLSLGTDDGVKIWFNGTMVHRVARLRALSLDEDNVELWMNAGENRLLLKIQQGKGGWGFAVRMLDNPNHLNILTGNIEFSLTGIDPGSKTLTVTSRGNLDQTFLKQAVQMEVYTTGGKTVTTKTFNCGEPIRIAYGQWPDGVYEFRYTYTDVRGTKSVKYNSWYKGDILAAARLLVKNAPDRSERTPESATHRMLADMILDRVGNNLETPDSATFSSLHSPLMEFAELTARKQIHAGGFVRMAYIDEIDNTPQFCRSYLPLHYDRAKKWPLVVYLHGYNGENPEYIRWWSVDKRHDATSDLHEAIFIEPHGRGNTQYLGIGDKDVLRCIEMAKQQFSVDEDRVYLTGASMGGFGTWNVATRHPELFAAIAPVYGGGDYHVNNTPESLEKMSPWERYLNDKFSSTAQLEALVNVPVLVMHGDQDQSVDVNLSRYLVRMLQRWNYSVRYIEVPGKGHTELGLWDQMVSWLLEHKRNPTLRHVRIRSADLQSASANWARVTQRISPFEFMEVDAELLEGNLIRVDSKNVASLSLSPGPPIDLKKPVTVVWNGKRDAYDHIRGGKIDLSEGGLLQGSPTKNSLIAGPIAEFSNTPFMFVTGTISGDSVARKIIAQKVEMMVGDWKASQKYEPRIKKDVDVTEADMMRYSLFVVGGPNENAITKKIVEKTPFRVQPGTISIDGRVFRADNAVLVGICPNPFNAERYVVIAAGTSGTALSFFDPRQRELSQYDYYVNDGKIPNYGAGAKNDKILIASGFFNGNWRLDDATLIAGDESLRSKCAYILVNNDLSTDIVSVAKPPVDLLRLYQGTYEIINGPQVTVFLRNDTLMASQGPFSARMLTVSENEFYIKEVNVSIAFEKDGTTSNYIMTGYQNGQKFTTKKVK